MPSPDFGSRPFRLTLNPEVVTLSETLSADLHPWSEHFPVEAEISSSSPRVIAVRDWAERVSDTLAKGWSGLLLEVTTAGLEYGFPLAILAHPAARQARVVLTGANRTLRSQLPSTPTDPSDQQIGRQQHIDQPRLLTD